MHYTCIKKWQINHSTIKQQNICFPNSFCQTTHCLTNWLTIIRNIFMCSLAPRSRHASIWSAFYLASTFLPARLFSFSLYRLPLAQTSAVFLLMSLTGGNLHPYMFSLQLHHGSSVLPNISVLCWWSPLWGVLPASLHYIFPLFRFSQRGLCHLAVLGPKCYLTPDNKSSRRLYNNIISELFPVETSLKLVL